MKKAYLISLVFIFTVSAGTVAWGAPNPNKAMKKEHADRNNDGKVDRKEMKMEKKWEEKQEFKRSERSWLHSRAKVNTPLEKKYDANNDGWLQPEEVKVMIKERETLISQNGKIKVDSVIEEEYDINKDGVIDAVEAVAFKKDVQ